MGLPTVHGTGSQSYTLAVISITPATATTGTVGVAYNQTTFAASGGTSPYTYAVTSGTLPAGLSLNTSTGALTGTPTAGGSFNFTVTATDTNNAVGSQAVSMTVNPPTIVVSTAALSTTATAGQAYTPAAVTASGGTSPYTYAIGSGALPAGMSLAGDGTLSGTPTATGTFNFTVTATDSSTGTGHYSGTSSTFTLTVNPPTITVSPASLSAATVGQAYTPSAFSASGGTSPYTYQISSGALPAGMSLSGDTLSGTPTAGGSFTFTVQATDSTTGGTYSGTKQYTLTVNAPTITVSPGTIANPQVGVPYSQQFSASGGTQGTGYTFAATGTVPAGLSLSGSGLLSGTPTSATSSASFTVTATDQSTGTGAPFTGSQGYTVSVAAPTLTISPASGTTLTAATQGSSYSQQFTVSGGTIPYNYQLSGGTLPNGLSLGIGGLLTGTPTQAGTFNFTVTATDSSTGTGSPFSVAGSYTLNVQAVAPVANPVSDTVSYGSSSNVVPLSFSGSTPTSVAIASPASHGTATASGTTITYTPISGYTGTDSFTYTGTNSAGTSAPATVSITVSGPTLAITSSSGGTSLTAQVGQSFTQTFTFSGGKAPYSNYKILGIPAGLGVTAFDSTSITVSGTPTVSGTFTLTVSGTDSSTGTDPSSGKNAPFTVNQTFSLVISTASMSMSPASGPLPGATAGSTYSQTFTTTGGISPYTYAVSGTLPAGLSLSTGGILSGTPTTAGNYSFTVTSSDASTGAGSPASTSAAYTLTVSAPTLTVTPTSLAGGTAGSAYSQTLSTSGGTAPYTYAVTTGVLPGGLSLSSNGALAGTPTVAGSFSFTVTTTDNLGFTGSKAYTLAVSAPTLVVTPANLSGGIVGTAYGQTLSTSGGTGPYAYAVTAGALPTGLSLSSSGALSGTPTAAGSSSFTVTTTDHLGFTGSKAYTLSVTEAAPVAVDDSATTLAGHAVTIAVTANDTGVITGVGIAHAPSHGTATVSGTSVVYTPANGFNGTDSFTYTATGPGGSSAPATVTVTVHPVPQAPSLTVNAIAGTALHVDLTSTASGGPFTGAALVSVSPASSGTAQVLKDGTGYRLDFTPLASYAGTVTIDYTLSNAYATSAPATITVSVQALPNPTRDAEVMGVLGAQADGTRRMARGQLGNFEQRLESLHDGGSSASFHNGLTVAPSGRTGNRGTVAVERPGIGSASEPMFAAPPSSQDDTAPVNPSSNGAGGVTVWTAGALNFGTQKLGGSRNGVDFHTDGITVGADKRLARNLAVGAGVGYGHDNSDIGDHGSRNTTNAYSVALYGSYQPISATYVDALVGYQWLSFDARRYVDATGGQVSGHRSGTQWFGSLAVGYEHEQGAWHISPYGRVDMASARLAGYTETGDSLYALRYDRMSVDTGTASLGLRASVDLQRDFGTLTPLFRVEYQHDFQQTGTAALRYANILSSPVYRADVGDLARNHTLLGLGLRVAGHGRLNLRMEYQNLIDSGTRNNQSVQFNLEYPFGP